MSDETKQADAPIAEGLDSWWKAAADNVDVAEREKEAIAAKQFAAQRLSDYVTSFTQPPDYGCRGLFRRLGRGIDWR